MRWRFTDHDVLLVIGLLGSVRVQEVEPGDVLTDETGLT
jgi:hypothetical protein